MHALSCCAGVCSRVQHCRQLRARSVSVHGCSGAVLTSPKHGTSSECAAGRASSALSRNSCGTSGSHQRDSDRSLEEHERKERVKLLLGHSCASQHPVTQGHVPAHLLQPEEFWERQNAVHREQQHGWAAGRKGGVGQELWARSLPGATGSTGSTGMVRCGWEAPQSSSARSIWNAKLEEKGFEVLLRPHPPQPATVVLSWPQCSLEHPRGELQGAGAELRRFLGNSNKMWVVQLLSINLSPERTIKRGNFNTISVLKNSHKLRSVEPQHLREV